MFLHEKYMCQSPNNKDVRHNTGLSNRNREGYECHGQGALQRSRKAQNTHIVFDILTEHYVVVVVYIRKKCRQLVNF